MPKIHEEVSQLTDEQVMALDGTIVSLSMIPTVWKQVTGRAYHRTTAIRAYGKKRIRPVGQNRGRLYFLINEVKAAAPSQKETRGRQAKKQNDEYSEVAETGIQTP
jgi:hypothetical protein